jgi:hypothetical protein
MCGKGGANAAHFACLQSFVVRALLGMR